MSKYFYLQKSLEIHWRCMLVAELSYSEIQSRIQNKPQFKCKSTKLPLSQYKNIASSLDYFF